MAKCPINRGRIRRRRLTGAECVSPEFAAFKCGTAPDVVPPSEKLLLDSIFEIAICRPQNQWPPRGCAGPCRRCWISHYLPALDAETTILRENESQTLVIMTRSTRRAAPARNGAQARGQEAGKAPRSARRRQRHHLLDEVEAGGTDSNGEGAEKCRWLKTS